MLSKTEFSFSCDGTNSGYKTTIYIYKAKFGLYADKGGIGEYKFGHSWWNFTVDDNFKAFIEQSYSDLNRNYYFGDAGWWPKGGARLYGPGTVLFGRQGHTATGSKIWTFNSAKALINGLEYVYELEHSVKDWSLLYDNCTHEAVKVGEKGNKFSINRYVGLSPADLSKWLNNN